MKSGALSLALSLGLASLIGLASASPASSQTTLRFSHTDSPNGSRHVVAEFFAEKVEEYTDGRYVMEVFHSGQLANDPRGIEMLRIGGLDFTVSATGSYAPIVDDLNLTALPYLFTDYEQAWAFYENSEWLKEQFAELEERNVKILSTWEAGFRSFTTTFPMESIDGIRGQRIRVFPNEMVRWGMEALGLSPIVMPVTDVYLGIQQGTVSGQENPVDTIFANRFYEVAPHVTLTQHVYSPIPMSVSTFTWNRLSAEDQDAIQRAADEAALFSREVVVSSELQQLEAMASAGATIVRPDIAPFQEAMTVVYDRAREVYGSSVDQILSEASSIR